MAPSKAASSPSITCPVLAYLEVGTLWQQDPIFIFYVTGLLWKTKMRFCLYGTYRDLGIGGTE